MKKRRIIQAIILIALLSVGTVFFFPRSMLHFDEPISEITVMLVHMAEAGKIEDTTYNYTPNDAEYSLILDCLQDYSYHYSYGTIKSLVTYHTSHSVGMEGNDAGYWIYIYLDTATERHTMNCGGTGEIMIDDFVYRVDYVGNRTQLEMMERLRSIVTPE